MELQEFRHLLPQFGEDFVPGLMKSHLTKVREEPLLEGSQGSALLLPFLCDWEGKPIDDQASSDLRQG